METQNLTDEQLNVMVTEAVGLYVHREGRVLYASRQPEPDFQRRLFAYEPLIQKFSTSLDACATFEATITDNEIPVYANAVYDEYTPPRPMGLYNHWFEPLVRSTPRQRCIAFLRMKGVL